MKLVLEIPDDKYAVMVGVAGWYEQALDTWINDNLTACLASDLGDIAEGQRKSKPIRELK